jgi:very-short-patch-repair endonuclease
MTKSDLEQKFIDLLITESERHGFELRAPHKEYRFHPTRKWRFDFAWPSVMVAVEIEGGTWSGGRHATGAGMAKDCDKYNSATAMGWRVLRFTGNHLRSPNDVFDTLLETMGVFAKDAS